MTATAVIDWDALIKDDRVHGSLYTDPDVWAAELERIWYRTHCGRPGHRSAGRCG